MRAAALLLCLALSGCGSDGGDAEVDGGGPGDPDAGGDPADAAAGSPDGATAAACARVTGTGGSGLNLREGPGTEYAVLATMPEGATVQVTGATSGVWREVLWTTQMGWASGDFLTDLASCDGGGGGGLMFLLPWTAEVAFYVTQAHNGGSHTGDGAWAWDFGLPAGTAVLAAHNGTVRRVRGDSSTGCCSSACSGDANYVVVDRGDGLESLYLHLSSAAVTEGQVVTRGELVGHSGETGWACGAHLHFQIQSSPGGGGTTSWYNTSVHEYFHDTGEAWDPPEGSQPVSKNGVLDLPALPPPDGPTAVAPHGAAGPAWDQAMRATAQ